MKKKPPRNLWRIVIHEPFNIATPTFSKVIPRFLRAVRFIASHPVHKGAVGWAKSNGFEDEQNSPFYFQQNFHHDLTLPLAIMMPNHNTRKFAWCVTRDLPFQLAMRQFSSVIALDSHDTSIAPYRQTLPEPRRPPRTSLSEAVRHPNPPLRSSLRAPERHKSRYFPLCHPTTQLCPSARLARSQS